MFVHTHEKTCFDEETVMHGTRSLQDSSPNIQIRYSSWCTYKWLGQLESICTNLRFMVKPQTGDIRMEWHTSDTRVHTDDIRVIYEWHRGTYEWHTNGIRVHMSDIRINISIWRSNRCMLYISVSKIKFKSNLCIKINVWSIVWC